MNGLPNEKKAKKMIEEIFGLAGNLSGGVLDSLTKTFENLQPQIDRYQKFVNENVVPRFTAYQKQLYDSYIKQGFTSEQALELVKSQCRSMGWAFGGFTQTPQPESKDEEK